MHLDRYKSVDSTDPYNIPWDLTQDGIATSLRISRAHASIELKKLREAGKVAERQAHIKGGKVKRKVYHLTPAGSREVGRIREFAEQNGIDIGALLDLKRQDAAVLLSELQPDDAFALGCACAFRVPVPLSALPKGRKSVIPTDVSERTVIDERLRRKVLDAADPEERAAWHSFAADYWLDDASHVGDDVDRVHERLYHLVEAGRRREACKHVSANMYDLIYTANEDLLETLSKIATYPARYAVDVLVTKAEAALILGDMEGLELAADALEAYDPGRGNLYHAEIIAAGGNAEEAKDMLRAANTDLARLHYARMLVEDGRFDKAKEALYSVDFSDDPVSSVQRYVLMARIDQADGRDGDALIHLMKARASVPDKGKRAIDSVIRDMNLGRQGSSAGRRCRRCTGPGCRLCST